jgi:hypothetical protein
MNGRRIISPYAAAFIVVLVCQLAYIYSSFPSAEEYQGGADEGTYFWNASIIVERGLAGFGELGREFLGDPRLQIKPPPIRIGHLLAGAVALRVERSFRALSVLSLVCHGLLSLATFVFVRRLWNEQAAFASAVLVVVSPLGAGLAGRALMDTDYCLFAALSLFTFLTWSTTGRRRDFMWFIVALMWALLVRETTFFFLPYFFAAIAVMKLRGTDHVRWHHLAVLALVPVAIVGVYAALFGGVGPVVSMAIALRRMTSPEMNAYVNQYNNGPWYEYLVDSLLLTPITTIVFLLFCGWYAGSPQQSRSTSLAIAYFWCGLAALSWLPQNPRYMIPLDPVVRLGAGLMVAAIFAGSTHRRMRTGAAGACLVAMAATDLVAFHDLFIKDRIYDPVAYNLAASRNLFPSAIHSARPPTTAEAYLEASATYYRARDFEAAIRMSERALALAPSDADAYNNIGASYCELGRWREAIPALEEALRLRPEFLLARNNLAWARGGLDHLIAERQR